MTDDAFLPDPWIMGAVTIGAAAVLWWLAAHLERDGNHHDGAWARFSAVMCLVLAVVVPLVVVRET